MPLQRITRQGAETLADFYSNHPHKLLLLERLNELFPDKTLWCLTSLNSLVLLDGDFPEGRWYMRIDSRITVPGGFRMTVLNHLKDKPNVEYFSTNIDEAVEIILSLMHESGGFKDVLG